MSEPKLTKWYPAGVKPVRKGIYQRNYSDNTKDDFAWSLWDGGHWMAGSYFFAVAKKRTSRTTQPGLPWRGLAADPKAKP